MHVLEIKAQNIHLILQSEKFDRGLEQMVPCSQAVKLNQDHHLVEFYKCYLNKEIFILVMLSSIGSNIFYRTTVMVRQQQEDM
jgi:hypothetical protein